MERSFFFVLSGRGCTVSQPAAVANCHTVDEAPADIGGERELFVYLYVLPLMCGQRTLYVVAVDDC